MATLFVDKIDPQSGTSLEIGSSGDTITIPAGATMVNNGTQTGFGSKGTNFFKATNTSATQAFNHGASTLVPYDTETYDPDSVYTNTSGNYKFTCQTAGYHYFIGKCQQDMGAVKSRQISMSFYKNGSQLAGEGIYYDNYVPGGSEGSFLDYSLMLSAVVNLAVDDYVQVYWYQTTPDGSNGSYKYNGNYNSFSGYRIAQ